jgi:hypothetical protein
MVTMFRGPRWKIAVYGRDHGVPHFHIEGPDFRCSVAIATFELIVGTVPTAVLKDALEWAGPTRRCSCRHGRVERMNVRQDPHYCRRARDWSFGAACVVVGWHGRRYRAGRDPQ